MSPALICGFDVGTYGLITCSAPTGGSPAFYHQINAYLHLVNPAPATKAALKAMGKPVIDQGKDLLVLGHDAIELAADFGAKVKRPMERGCVGADESCYPILAAMLQGMINRLEPKLDVVLYYSKPANAVSADTNVDLHGSLLQGIFEGYALPEGKKMHVVPMNEAAAIIFSDCPDKTGFAISTGAGMVNVAYVKFGVPIFAFSIAQSGDFIDQTVAKATGKAEAVVNLEKCRVDIGKPPTNQFELILRAQYELLIRSSIEKIIKGIEEFRGAVSVGKPVPIVIGGGVSSIEGFMPLFNNILAKYKFPLEISEARRAQQGVLAVAHGLYQAALSHE